jgi:hypothetical protein
MRCAGGVRRLDLFFHIFGWQWSNQIFSHVDIISAQTISIKQNLTSS